MHQILERARSALLESSKVFTKLRNSGNQIFPGKFKRSDTFAFYIEGEENFLVVNFSDKVLALQYKGKVLIRDLVFDEPDKFVTSLPYINGAALSDGNKVVFQIDLMHLFGQDDPRKSEYV